MPPAHLHGGAHLNLLAPDSVTFIFFAPHKPFVSLIGDFNGWDTRATPLFSNGHGLWWTTIPHPGATRYGYYVAVDEQSHAWVADPYATEVEWHNHSAWAVLPESKPAFAWSDGDWRTPPMRELVIYELCVRDFVGRWEGSRPRYGTLADLLEKVDYLAECGVNAVELMPIQAFPGNSSWGYNPVYYFAVAQSYGKPDDLKRLVDACHRRGIAVILDMALNHAWGEHPYYTIYPPMYGPKGEWLPNWNPFFHHTPNAVNAWGGVDWNHFAPVTTHHFQEVVRYWLAEYHIDGLRFDWVCGVDYDSNEPHNPGFNPYHGINAIAWAARQQKSDCLLIGEFWQLDGTHPDKTAAKLLAETALDAIWNGVFHHTVDQVLNQRWQWEKSDIRAAIGGFRSQGFRRAAQLINYTASHDEVRPEHEIRFYTAQHIARPPAMSIDELALARARLGLVALMAGAGVPMIYAGQEYGDDSPRTIDFLPQTWFKLNQPLHQVHLALTRRLIQARRQHAALRSDHIEFAADSFEESHLVRFRRWDERGDHAVVALNFGWQPVTTDLHFPCTGQWYNAVSGQVHTVHGQRQTITLQPFEAVLFLAPR